MLDPISRLWLALLERVPLNERLVFVVSWVIDCVGRSLASVIFLDVKSIYARMPSYPRQRTLSHKTTRTHARRCACTW